MHLTPFLGLLRGLTKMDAMHERTLMRPTLREWLNPGDPMFPRVVELRCQECGKILSVERAFFVRGDYFCDGGDGWQYVPNKPGVPSMSEVMDGPGTVSGAALDSLAELYAELSRIQDKVDEAKAQLENIIFRFGGSG